MTIDKEAATGFHILNLPKPLIQAIEKAGFTQPTPIQIQAIPAVLAGKDVLGLAQTGTGKTAAFLLPILSRLLDQDGRSGISNTVGSPQRHNRRPRVLVVAPTRELAAQILAECRVLAEFTPYTGTAIFGGVSQVRQIASLAKSPDFIIGCPGRLLDLIKQGKLDLSVVDTLVLDEADQMFDMGFFPDIKRILAKLPATRQNLLFSATMPKEVRALADAVLKQPAVVDIKAQAPAETVSHSIYPVGKGHKVNLLLHLMDAQDVNRTIVFTRTKHMARKVSKILAEHGFSATALQGNMSQPQREKAMRGFREGEFEVLVATDIAARGIDVSSVSHVINFDVPSTAEAYTHRIGRTGRAERSGIAITFATTEDKEQIRDIEKRLQAPIERTVLSAFAEGVAVPRDSRATPEYDLQGRSPRGQRPQQPQRPAKPKAAATTQNARNNDSNKYPKGFGAKDTAEKSSSKPRRRNRKFKTPQLQQEKRP